MFKFICSVFNFYILNKFDFFYIVNVNFFFNKGNDRSSFDEFCGIIIGYFFKKLLMG